MALLCCLSLLLLILTQIFGLLPPAASDHRHSLSYSECIRLERWATESPNRGQSSVAKLVSVREGHSAYLHCPQPKRQRRKDLKAAWTRLSDEALIAVGTSTFTPDPRFQVSKPRKNESDWVLILRRPGPGDQGCYLCEMNTEPTSTLFPTYLKVAIDGNTETGREETLASDGLQMVDKMRKFNTYLQINIEGNSLLLNCTVEGVAVAGELPLEVQWTRNGQTIDPKGGGGKERQLRLHWLCHSAQCLCVIPGVHLMPKSINNIPSSLRIREASPEDSGLYTCDGDRLVRSAQTINLVPSFAPGTFCPSWTTLNLVAFWHLITVFIVPICYNSIH